MDQLLVMNIDGTLVDYDGKIHKATRNALQYVENKGIKIVLATSKSLIEAQKIARQLNIQAIIISHHGAYIASTSNRPIYVKRISEKLTLEITELLEEYNCEIKVLRENDAMTNKVKESFLSFKKQQNQVSLLLKEKPIASTKIEVNFETIDDTEEVKLLLRQLSDEVEWIEMNSFTLEITSKNVNKLFGLQYVCDQLKIHAEEVVVIGSSMADIHMLQYAGLGVAMQNSPEQLKKNADWITRSVENAGVSYMIMEHFRKQQKIPIE